MQGGGAERVVSELSMQLMGQVETQTFVCWNNGQCYPLPSAPIQLQLKHIPIPKLGSLISLITSTIRYTHYLRKKRPAISISFGEGVNIINTIACYLTCTPCITSVHSNPSIDACNNHYFKRIEMYLSRKIAKFVVATSEGIRDALITDHNQNPDKVVTIYNPINIFEINSKKMEPLIDPFFNTRLPIIIAVGWLSHVKGQWHLIRVFSEIQKIIPSKLIICGAGVPCGDNYYAKYMKLIQKLGLNDKVYLAGWQENPYKYIKNSTVFVHPSISESFSNVIVEALACGCPVVASDCNFGPRETLGYGKYGLLCSCSESDYLECEPLIDSEIDMMNNILLLLNNSDLYEEFRMKGYERAKDFDAKQATMKYMDLFKQICEFN